MGLHAWPPSSEYRMWRPDSSLRLQVQVLKRFKLFPLRSEADVGIQRICFEFEGTLHLLPHLSCEKLDLRGRPIQKNTGNHSEMELDIFLLKPKMSYYILNLYWKCHVPARISGQQCCPGWFSSYTSILGDIWLWVGVPWASSALVALLYHSGTTNSAACWMLLLLRDQTFYT